MQYDGETDSTGNVGIGVGEQQLVKTVEAGKWDSLCNIKTGYVAICYIKTLAKCFNLSEDTENQFARSLARKLPVYNISERGLLNQ